MQVTEGRAAAALALALVATLAWGAPGVAATPVSPGIRTLSVGANPVAAAVEARRGLAFVVTQGTQDVLGRFMGDGVVRIVDLAGERLLRSVSVGAAPAAVAVDERSGRVFVANYGDRSVSMIDIRRAAVVRTVRVGIGPRSLAVDEQHGRVLVVSEGLIDSMGTLIGSASVSVLDAASGNVLHTVPAPFGSYPTIGGVDERSGHAFILDNSGAVTMLDTASGKALWSASVGPLYNLATPGPNSLMAVDSGSAHAFVVDNVAARLTMLDTRTGAVLWSIPIRAPGMTLVTGQHGHIYLLDGDNTISTLNNRTGNITRTVRAIPAPASPAEMMAVDDRRGRAFVATSVADRSGQRQAVHVVDLKRGADIADITVPGDRLGAMAVDPENGRLLVVSSNGQAPPGSIAPSGAGWLSIAPPLFASK